MQDPDWRDRVASPAGLEVLSPMTGWLWPLSLAPDAAFAGGAIGPGLAIDPLDPAVHAPIAGTIVTFNASHHAVVIRHASGAEILVHVGIDTVALAGTGFTPAVQVGDAVAAGDLLLTCDLDAIAAAGKSLVSPLVVLSPAGARIELLAGEGPVTCGDPLFRLVAGGEASAEAATGPALRRTVTIGLPHGVHARPAAALTAQVRGGGLSGTLETGERRADLASVVALMRAGFAHGERVEIVLHGSGAGAGIERIAALLSGDFAEALPQPGAAPVAEGKPAPAAGVLAGLTGSPGLAVGPACHHQSPHYDLRESGEGIEAEQARLEQALRAVDADLTAAAPGVAASQVFAAHRELLADPELRAAADKAIAAGRSAGFAWQQATQAIAADFARGEAWLAERQADLADLAGRVLARLTDGPPVLAPVAPGSILLAGDLLPSQVAHYAACGVAGIALGGSSPTAHVAIIAAGLGLPLVTGLGAALDAIAEGGIVILDASAGRLVTAPDAPAIASAEAAVRDRQLRAAVDLAAAQAPALTRDGQTVPVLANLGGTGDAEKAAAAGADGCGLLRTEFLFLDRDRAPDAGEQVAAYRAVMTALGARPLTIRTLDVGGDKPVRFLPLAGEENPALGLRGIRVGFAWPELLATQLEAILRAAQDAPAPVELMVPMIVDGGEWQRVKEAVALARSRTGAAGPVRLGLMIETPAAVLLADQLSAQADFLSIGTNDLTQYVLASDRTNKAMAAAADPMHPAVLRAIAQVCEAAAANHCPVSVCGGLAGDPLAVPLLLGLGVSKLSVVPAQVPVIKLAVRDTDRGRWAALAREALALASPDAVRAFCRAHISTQEQGQ